MKTRILAISFFIVAWVMASAVVYAEAIQGKIVELNPQEHSLEVAQIDPKTGTPGSETAQIVLLGDTQFEGVSFEQLKVGDEIKIDVVTNPEKGFLAAKKIQLG